MSMPKLKVHPMIQRAVMGAGLGALLGSGLTKGVGAQFLTNFLKPLSTNHKALGYIAAVMYEREQRGKKGWLALSEKDQELWRERAANAVDAMMKMMSEALAGGINR